MNIRIVLRLLGIISFVVSGSMALSLVVGLVYGDGDAAGILEAMAVSAAVGALLYVTGKAPGEGVLRREGLAVVGLSWILAAGLGALPYAFTGSMASFIDCYFESMSGFTTTGSSILTPSQIDALPHGVQFWRCFTQWLGGMGIVVLFVAIIPFLRASGKQLFFTEVPGPLSETLQPRVRDTAIALWKIYLGLTGILTALLIIEGFSFYEAICHAFTTMSTGGFSTSGASIGGFQNPAAEVTIIVFMAVAGVNFGLYYRAFSGDWRPLARDPELRFYVFLLVVCTSVIALELSLRRGQSPVESLRHAGFTVSSLMTTTGYGTADFSAWPSFSQCLLVVLMFVGGCAGSTGGGIKVIRILVLIKHALIETEKAFRPQTVRSLKVGSVVIEEQTRWTILAFFAIMMGTMVLCTLVMSALGMDPVSAMTSVAATLNNIGPGLGSVYASFADVPDAGKAVLALCMVVGRLEVFSILVLLSPGLWRAR